MLRQIPYPENLPDYRLADCPRWTPAHEVAYLCWLARQSKGDILEIGCNEGRTTLDLATANPDKRVWALDYTGPDDTLCPEQRGEKPARERIGIHAAHLPNVRILNQKSQDALRQLAQSPRRFGLIFIDGDHTYAGVERDTELAFNLLAPDGAIAWHDCEEGAPAWVGVRRYLTELSAILPIAQVASTWLAVLRQSDLPK